MAHACELSRDEPGVLEVNRCARLIPGFEVETKKPDMLACGHPARVNEVLRIRCR
jgi:hypothetical protein